MNAYFSLTQVNSSMSSSEEPMFMQLHTSHVDSLTTMISSDLSTFTTITPAVAPSTSMIATTENSSVCFVPETLEMVPWPLAQYFLIFLYSCTSLLALVGNLTVILVSSLGSESAPTIRLCLANLAVSDIILAVVCVPFSFTDYLYGQWVFPHWLCPTAQFAQLLSVFVTSMTLTVIGIERYHATLRPFSSVHRWLCSHTRPLLLSTWVFGSCYAYIPFQNTGTRAFTLANATYYECSYDNGVSITQRRVFMTTNLLLTFLLPLIVLIIAYTAIMRKLIADQSPPMTDSTVTSSTASSSIHRLPQTYHFKNGNATEVNSPSSGRFTEEPVQQKTLTNGVPKALVVVNKREERLTARKKKRKKKENVVNENASSPNGNGTTFVIEMTTTNSNGSGESNASPTDAMLFANGSNNGHRQLRPFRSSGQRKSVTTVNLRKSANTNRSRTIKMLFMVVALYGTCWAPIKLYQFLLDYGVLSYCSEFSLQTLVAAYFSCHWLAMFNSAINPIIYSFFSLSFRNDFKKITRSCRLGGQSSSTICRNYSLKTASTMV